MRSLPHAVGMIKKLLSLFIATAASSMANPVPLQRDAEWPWCLSAVVADGVEALLTSGGSGVSVHDLVVCSRQGEQRVVRYFMPGIYHHPGGTKTNPETVDYVDGKFSLYNRAGELLIAVPIEKLSDEEAVDRSARYQFALACVEGSFDSRVDHWKEDKQRQEEIGKQLIATGKDYFITRPLISAGDSVQAHVGVCPGDKQNIYCIQVWRTTSSSLCSTTYYAESETPYTSGYVCDAAVVLTHHDRGGKIEALIIDLSHELVLEYRMDRREPEDESRYQGSHEHVTATGDYTSEKCTVRQGEEWDDDSDGGIHMKFGSCGGNQLVWSYDSRTMQCDVKQVAFRPNEPHEVNYAVTGKGQLRKIPFYAQQKTYLPMQQETELPAKEEVAEKPLQWVCYDEFRTRAQEKLDSLTELVELAEEVDDRDSAYFLMMALMVEENGFNEKAVSYDVHSDQLDAGQKKEVTELKTQVLLVNAEACAAVRGAAQKIIDAQGYGDSLICDFFTDLCEHMQPYEDAAE